MVETIEIEIIMTMIIGYMVFRIFEHIIKDMIKGWKEKKGIFSQKKELK